MITPLLNPEFLFCEIPIKTGDIVQDNRNFIYCPNYLCLIEAIPMDTFVASFPIEQYQKTFYYVSEFLNEKEEFLLVFTQNNLALINDTVDTALGQKLVTEEELINKAWLFYRDFLIWQDKQMYNNETIL